MHGAAVRLAHLAGDKQVGHNELVDVQLAAEGAQGLDAPVTVDLGNVQEPGDEIPGQHHGPQPGRGLRDRRGGERGGRGDGCGGVVARHTLLCVQSRRFSRWSAGDWRLFRSLSSGSK